MKIYQWIGVCSMMLSTACSNQVFTPSEDFTAQNKVKSISTEELLRISSNNGTLDMQDELKVLGWKATSDENIAEDVARDQIEVEVEDFEEKVEILGKKSHDGANYMLVLVNNDEHVWLKY
jgi:hypothetical protein